MTDLPVEEIEAMEAAWLVYAYELPAECAPPQEWLRCWLAAREYSKQREEETRLALDKVCALMAVPDCSECQGDGIDYEGDEWCVCDCVLSKQREEELEGALRDLQRAVSDTPLQEPRSAPDPRDCIRRRRALGDALRVVWAVLAENVDMVPDGLGDRRPGA